MDHQCRNGRVDFVAPGARDHYPPDLLLEPVHLDIDLKVDLDAQTAAGTVIHSLRCRLAGARTLELHAVDFLNLTLDGLGHDLSHVYDGEVITLTWATPFEFEEERKLAVRYEVVKPTTGLFFSRPDAHYPDAPYFAVTDHETERARHWLPTIDLPAVRPTLAIHLRAPQQYTIEANGMHESDDVHDDGTKTSHFRLDQRCPSYLTCFIVGQFVRHDDGDHDGKPLSYFAPPPFTPQMLRLSFGKTGAMLKWMEQKLNSALPWPKYFQFAARGIGGAMENISLVSWDDRWVLDESLAPELGPLVDIINLHEMAHTWFGDLIVVRDYAHAWLKESWATYMESCWLEDSAGSDEHLYSLFANGQAYLEEADTRYKRPIVTRRFNSSWNMFDRHLYPGGAYRLHMLRRELGDATFWSGVQTYVARFAGKTVETDDFRRVMEEVSGRSLVRWFEQWLYSKGYPSLGVKFEWSAERKQGTFEFTQTQRETKGDDSAEQEPLFVFDIQVGWMCAGEHYTDVVSVKSAKTTARFNMAENPQLVTVNADGRVLCKLDFDPGAPRLLAALSSADDLLTRIHAAWMLTKGGKRAHIEAIKKAFAREPFWGARVQFAKALGEAGSVAAVDALVELLKDHSDPLSLPALITAAGHYRDPRISEVLQERIDRGIGPRAREAAYRTLGLQRSNAPFERLQQASLGSGVGGFAQSGALLGLAETRRPEALPILEARVRYGAIDPRARPAAAQAIGILAARLEVGPRERAVELLCDLLRDPDAVVQRAAAEGLAAAAAVEAVPQLEAYRRRLTHQEQDQVLRLVQRLRHSQQDLIKQTGQTLEELQDRVRKLEDQLSSLKQDTQI